MNPIQKITEFLKNLGVINADAKVETDSDLVTELSNVSKTTFAELNDTFTKVNDQLKTANDNYAKLQTEIKTLTDANQKLSDSFEAYKKENATAVDAQKKEIADSMNKLRTDFAKEKGSDAGTDEHLSGDDKKKKEKEAEKTEAEKGKVMSFGQLRQKALDLRINEGTGN